MGVVQENRNIDDVHGGEHTGNYVANVIGESNLCEYEWVGSEKQN